MFFNYLSRAKETILRLQVEKRIKSYKIQMSIKTIELEKEFFIPNLSPQHAYLIIGVTTVDTYSAVYPLEFPGLMLMTDATDDICKIYDYIELLFGGLKVVGFAGVFEGEVVIRRMLKLGTMCAERQHLNSFVIFNPENT